MQCILGCHVIVSFHQYQTVVAKDDFHPHTGAMITVTLLAILATGAFGSAIILPVDNTDVGEDHHNHQQISLEAPCPVDWNSAPCECSGHSKAPNIDCSLADNADQLPQVFHSLPNDGLPFVTFTLHQSKLTSLPPNPFFQSNFTAFVISETNVTMLPDDFFKSSQNTVRSISITNTLITDFPFRAFRGYPKLETLILENNRITNIPPEAFGNEGLPALHDLNLKGNEIKMIGSYAFSNIPFLYKLDMSNNNLTRIEKQAFAMQNHKESVVLSLAKNMINEIDKDAFQDLTFSSIHLEFNQLTTLNRGVFEPLLQYLDRTDSSVYLMGNPFVCNTTLQWLVEKSLPIKQHLRDFVCPNGKTWETLTSSDLLDNKRP